MYVRLHFLCFIVYQVHVQSQQEVADIVTMDPLWIEFRSSPSVYLSSRKMDIDAFVNDVLQVRMYELAKHYRRTTSLCNLFLVTG